MAATCCSARVSHHAFNMFRPWEDAERSGSEADSYCRESSCGTSAHTRAAALPAVAQSSAGGSSSRIAADRASPLASAKRDALPGSRAGAAHDQQHANGDGTTAPAVQVSTPSSRARSLPPVMSPGDRCAQELGRHLGEFNACTKTIWPTGATEAETKVDLNRQNELLLNLLFDAEGRLMYHEACVYQVFNISKGRLHRLQERAAGIRDSRHGLIGRRSNNSKKPETQQQFVEFARVFMEQHYGAQLSELPPAQKGAGSRIDLLRARFNEMQQRHMLANGELRETISRGTCQTWFRLFFGNGATASSSVGNSSAADGRSLRRGSSYGSDASETQRSSRVGTAGAGARRGAPSPEHLSERGSAASSPGGSHAAAAEAQAPYNNNEAAIGFGGRHSHPESFSAMSPAQPWDAAAVADFATSSPHVGVGSVGSWGDGYVSRDSQRPLFNRSNSIPFHVMPRDDYPPLAPLASRHTGGHRYPPVVMSPELVQSPPAPVHETHGWVGPTASLLYEEMPQRVASEDGTGAGYYWPSSSRAAEGAPNGINRYHHRYAPYSTPHTGGGRYSPSVPTNDGVQWRAY